LGGAEFSSPKNKPGFGPVCCENLDQFVGVPLLATSFTGHQ